MSFEKKDQISLSLTFELYAEETLNDFECFTRLEYRYKKNIKSSTHIKFT